MQVILNRVQYQYLRDNGILEQYKTNIKNDKDHDCDYSNISDFINHSFTWSDTPEGYDFWREHDSKSNKLKTVDIYTMEL